MIITITGPRSVGKTTISRIVAKKLKLKYLSSDEKGNKAMKKYGGLDKSIKSGIIKGLIKKKGYNLITREYKKSNFVFDLSGGSFSYNDFPKVSKEVREIAKKNSIVIGLLPYKNKRKSVNLLFSREIKRKHLKGVDKKALLERTKRRYDYFPEIFKKNCNYIIYVGDKKPGMISKEIIEKVEEGKR